MSLSATCRAGCDGCGCEVVREVVLNDDTARGIMESHDDGVYSGATYAADIWSWCHPEGWLHVPKDEVTGRKYLFFHSGDCYKDWLRGQGRLEEVTEFEQAIWIA